MSLVCVVGSINADIVVSMERLTRPGETLSGNRLEFHPGGKGANQALAALRAGATLRFAANVGDDQLAPIALGALHAEGASRDYLRQISGVPTGVALIRVAADGENDIVVVPGANHVWPSNFDVDEFLHGADLVMLQMEIPIQVNMQVLKAARRMGLRTMLNPSPWAPSVLDLLPFVDLLVLNETEAGYLLGIAVEHVQSDPEHAARAVLGFGPNACVLTLGATGHVTAESSATVRSVRDPAFKVCAVDTTAAGDTFAGYAAARLASGDSLPVAAHLAAAAAAICVTRRGAQSSIPNIAEVSEFLAQR